MLRIVKNLKPGDNLSYNLEVVANIPSIVPFDDTVVVRREVWIKGPNGISVHNWSPSTTVEVATQETVDAAGVVL